MRTLIYSLLIIVIILGGCSSPTLLEAIEKNYDNAEILVQDDDEQIVLFQTEDYTGQPMLVLNDFFMDKSKYKYSSNGEYGVRLDLTSSYKVVNVTPVGNIPVSALWGMIYNYPNAEMLWYSLIDEEGNVLYESSVKINEKNFVYEKLPNEFHGKYEEFNYKILDHEGNVIVEF